MIVCHVLILSSKLSSICFIIIEYCNCNEWVEIKYEIYRVTKMNISYYAQNINSHLRVGIGGVVCVEKDGVTS